MSKVCLDKIWDDEYEKIAIEVDKATKSIIETLENNIDENVVENIFQVCSFWTKHTYVGRKKDAKVQKSFQLFFEKFMDLILAIRDKQIDCDEDCREAFSKLLYNGVVYRKLGHGDSENCKHIIKPEFDNIYVSWNKEKENAYLDTKLYGPVTLLTAEITEPYYGIDLEKLGVCAGEEREIVFPTYEKFIKDIEIIEEVEDNE